MSGMTVWLTAREAAEYCKSSLTTIREAVKAGDLIAHPVGKSGREYRVTADAVDEWMKSRTWEPRRVS